MKHKKDLMKEAEQLDEAELAGQPRSEDDELKTPEIVLAQTQAFYDTRRLEEQ